MIPLSPQHYQMLQRNLVFTEVTRGKRLAVLLGQRKALAIAVKGARDRRRWPKLPDAGRMQWIRLDHHKTLVLDNRLAVAPAPCMSVGHGLPLTLTCSAIRGNLIRTSSRVIHASPTSSKVLALSRKSGRKPRCIG